jgi:hypothetical protein
MPHRARAFAAVHAFVIAGMLCLLSCHEDHHHAPPPEPPAVPTSTVLLDAPTLAELAGVSDDGATLTFAQTTATLDALAPDTIIVSDVAARLPNGFLGRVTAVERNADGTIVVHTASASIEEAVLHGEVHVAKHLTSADLLQSVALVRGATFGKPAKGDEALRVTFDDVVLYDADADPETTNDRVTLAGAVTIDPALDFSLAIADGKLTQVGFTHTLNATAQIALASGAPVAELHETRAISRFAFQPLTTHIDWFPIVISPVVTIYAGADGRVSAGVEAGVTGAATLTSALSYAEAAWSNATEHTNAFAFTPPLVAEDCNVTAFAKPDFALLLYGRAGSTVALAESLALEADLAATPWWELAGGLRVDLDVECAPLSPQAADYAVPAAIDESTTLARADTPPPVTGTVDGVVRNALTRDPLEGVRVEVHAAGALLASALSNASGEYALKVPAGSGYTVVFAKDGYLDAHYANVTLAINSTLYLETVLQIATANTGPGAVSGLITNAFDGTPIAGAGVALRGGINVQSGEPIVTTAAGADGLYRFENLAAGNYTAQATAAGYTEAFFSVVCIGDTSTDNQNGALTPNLPPSQTRIILSWGDAPRDLDSHLTGPLPDGTRFHLYWLYAESRPNNEWPYGNYAKLDLDDTFYYGPETTTIYDQLPGVYRFSVHDFSNREVVTGAHWLARSAAVVRVYKGERLAATFNVPANQDGTLWTVFEMDGDTITPINTMTYVVKSADVQAIVGASETRTDAALLRDLPEKPTR